MESKDKNTVLVLSDGTIFSSKSCGKTGTVTGEIAFNTGMSGYQEIFTDLLSWTTQLWPMLILEIMEQIK